MAFVLHFSSWDSAPARRCLSQGKGRVEEVSGSHEEVFCGPKRHPQVNSWLLRGTVRALSCMPQGWAAKEWRKSFSHSCPKEKATGLQRRWTNAKREAGPRWQLSNRPKNHQSGEREEEGRLWERSQAKGSRHWWTEKVKMWDKKTKG